MSEETNTYTLGEVVRVDAPFKNSAGGAIDPTAVLFKFKDPEGVVTTYTYGTDAELVKDSTGNYHVDIDADKRGTYYWRFYSTGTGKAADEGSFEVEDSNFS